MSLSPNPPPECSERNLQLDLSVVGAESETLREAMLESIELIITEHLEETIKAWNSRYDVTVSYLLDT